MTATFSLALAVVAGVVVALTGVWSARRRGGRVRFVDFVVMACVWGGVVATAAVIGVAGFRFDRWDLMSVVYVPVVVGLPIAAVLLLASHVTSRWLRWCPSLSRPASAVAALMALAAPVGFYATHVAPFRLHVDRIDVAVGADRVAEPVVVGVIADIQTEDVTGYERSAVEELVEADPDVILIAGDIWQGSPEGFDQELEELRALLAAMDAPGGVYVVPGDVDSPEELAALTAGTGVEALDGEIARTEVAGTGITIGGVGLEPHPQDRVALAELETAPGDELRILLAHRPDWAYELPADSRVDLVVAGHTHGGQIQLPGIGALATASRWVARRAAAGGLHELNGNTTYISAGVGHEQQGAPQVRFLAPPSIGVLSVRP